MTYDEAIHFWFGRINYEQKTPRPSDLSLDRIRTLLTLLNDPHERYRIVHVAGSKGKGSTAAFLAAILGQAGFRVGLFTSPHLASVHERIQVGGQPISAEEIRQGMSDIQAASRALRDSAALPDGIYPLEQTLTFFEVATALGYLHFARRRVDVAVVEVGMGGRFDSTNVCRPIVSVITSISFDHTRQLGNTLDRIAFEKAGIIKPGRPAVSGVRAAPAREVIERICRERGAKLRQVDVDYHFEHRPALYRRGDERPPHVDVRTWKRVWPRMRLALVGEHQAANAALAVATIEVLREEGLVISADAVAAGLANTCWPARLECVGRDPLVLLDCAHNVASAEALLEALKTSYPLAPSGKRVLVFAGSRDKDLPGMLKVLAPAFAHIVLTRFSQNPRSVPTDELRQMLTGLAVGAVEEVNHPVEAWRRARAAASEKDLICITGSVFLAGELRSVFALSS